jgi:regulator of protease activity HflC (stomatin/prohibitin superfamily)
MKDTILGFLAIIIGFLLVLAMIVGLWTGFKTISRSQRLSDERNQTQVNDIQIAQTAQLVKVEQQKAQIRVVQAGGIAQSQKIIAGSLTQAYLQYEAIEAQKAEVSSPNHTVIYIPSSSNGVPLVSTVPQN